MPVYLVTVPTNPPTEKLVNAANTASARGHVARQVITVAVAKQADLFRIAKAGGDIEEVSDPAAPLLPTEQITSEGHSGGPGSNDGNGGEQPDAGKRTK